MLTRAQSVIGAVVIVALIVAYVVLTVTDHDATALLAVLIGYIGGAATPAVAQAARPEEKK